MSWRVYLLPFLQEESLFRQFKLDESWDSENDKKLISKMPNIFATHNSVKDGKSRIHVFVGPYSPFGTQPKFNVVYDVNVDYEIRNEKFSPDSVYEFKVELFYKKRNQKDGKSRFGSTFPTTKKFQVLSCRRKQSSLLILTDLMET